MCSGILSVYIVFVFKSMKMYSVFKSYSTTLPLSLSVIKNDFVNFINSYGISIKLFLIISYCEGICSILFFTNLVNNIFVTSMFTYFKPYVILYLKLLTTSLYNFSYFSKLFSSPSN